MASGGAFWEDLEENLKDPEFRRAWVAELRRGSVGGPRFVWAVMSEGRVQSVYDNPEEAFKEQEKAYPYPSDLWVQELEVSSKWEGTPYYG